MIAGLAIAPACGPDHAAAPSSHAGPPQRIVCANTAAAEFVCRLVDPERLSGLPEQIDDYGTFDARHNGYEHVTRFPRYVAEPVLVLRPDLVVTHEWQSADTTSVLRSQGIEVLVLKSARSYADIRETLTHLGTLLDASARATAVIKDLDARVEKLRSTSASRSKLTAMVYSNDGTGGTTAGSHTTPDTMILLAGLRNAAAEAGIADHVQIDFERLIAIDPDFLIVAAPARGEGGSATKSVVESSPALARLKSRAAGHIIVLPAALMSADSPPLVDAAELLAREVDRVLAPK
jgi:iron complex transport system substrate-binding protein